METAALVIFHQTVLQGGAGDDLKVGIERGAHRKAALVERLVAVTLDELATHFFGEIIRCEDMGAGTALLDAERLLLGVLGIGLSDVAVLGHAVDDPVATLERRLFATERMVVGRSLGKGGKIGGLGRRQLGHRLVEIGERCAGDAVGVQAEKDLVQVEFEDLVLRIGLLDAEGEDRFLDLAVDRLVGGEQEVLRHLLGDRRGAFRATAGTEVLEVREDGSPKTRDVDAGMAVEILVFSRKERRLDPIRHRLNGQEEAPFAGILRHQGTVAGMNAGRDRRLVGGKHLVVRQVLGHTGEVDTHAGSHDQKQDAGQTKEITNQSYHIGATVQLSFGA